MRVVNMDIAQIAAQLADEGHPLADAAAAEAKAHDALIARIEDEIEELRLRQTLSLIQAATVRLNSMIERQGDKTGAMKPS